MEAAAGRPECWERQSPIELSPFRGGTCESCNMMVSEHNDIVPGELAIDGRRSTQHSACGSVLGCHARPAGSASPRAMLGYCARPAGPVSPGAMLLLIVAAILFPFLDVVAQSGPHDVPLSTSKT